MTLQYLSPTSDWWALDTEGDSLTPTQIWVVCVENITTGEQHSFRDAETFKRWLKPQHVFVTHNGIHFDIPVLNRLWDAGISIDRCVDTFVLGYLFDPYILGGHSLHAWGVRVKLEKLDFNDFSTYTPEMEYYCSIDTRICKRTYLALAKRMRVVGYSNNSIWLEHHFADIIDRQERRGFQFDIAGARNLYSQLRERERELGEQIARYFPPKLKSAGVHKYRLTASGRPYSSYVKHTERYPEVVHRPDGTYECFDYHPFNIASGPQRLARLLEAGFKPTKKTKKGGWSTDEESVLGFAESSGIPEVKMIAEWLVHNGRANMIRNWLENANLDSGRIHGRVFSCGAGSRRCTHASPNSANIPSTEAQYGTECRSLWTASDGRVLVGIDAAGLEGRVLVHYLGAVVPERLQEAYDYIIDTQAKFGVKDFHTLNAQQITKRVIPKERKPVKNDFYALIYGATDRKLGTMSGGDEELGSKIRTVLGDAVPGLAELMEDARNEFTRTGGLIRCLDGGFVRCPSPHAALNYRCQSAGAIIMKLGAIILDREIGRHGWDVWKVGDIHDEWQFDSHPDCAELVGKAGIEAIKLAGVKLGVRVPLDGTFAIAKNWAGTH